MRGAPGRQRFVILGLAVALMFTLMGWGFALAAPSSITTCTKTSTGKMKVIASSDVANCTKKGKGTATTWDSHTTTVALAGQLAATQSQLADSQQATATALRYRDLLRGSTACGGPTDSFEGLNLHGAYLPVCLHGVDLAHADLASSHLDGVNLVQADLRFADIRTLFVDTAFFWSANLSSANLSGSNLYQSEFTNANMTNANLSSANLQFAKLTGATMTGANVTGVTWDRTTCPDGTRSDTNGTTPQSCVGHGV